MNAVQFSVVANGQRWAIETDGDVGGDYVTRESAFEALVGEASNAIRKGEAVEIVVNRPPATRVKSNTQA